MGGLDLPESLIIDRFEGDYAVCERADRTTVDIPRNELPRQAQVGDVIQRDGAEWIIDTSTTTSRRKRIADLAAGLWQREKQQ
jgi:hypothetical protein